VRSSLRALPLLLLSALMLGGCTRSVPAGERPSILLVTLDTTRADRLGPYGYPLARTPTYDQLAEEGTLFQRAYSTCPLTIPSHSTILTGRVPPSHGVRDNGDFVLGEDAVTLAEQFREAGWTTAAFTAAFPTQRRWGFDQGFDLYRDPLDDLPTRLDWRDERRAGEVVDDALEHLPELEGPLFVWVHLFDAHWPYDPPEPWASAQEGRPYDGEIAYASDQVGRLLEWWDARFARSTVLVTADHGEGMGDGGERTHGFLLHDGTIRVPLIARGVGFEAGIEVVDPVGHTDIAPTLLNIAGLPLNEGLQGADLREGGSDRMYSEALTGQFNLGLAPLFAYTEVKGRYTEGGHGDWYDTQGHSVLSVPLPDHDLADPQTQLAALRATFDEVIAEEATLDAQAMEQLIALGYLGGDTVSPAGEIDPRDVIDIVPLTWRVRQAMSRGRLAVADALITRLEERMPGTYGVDQLRAHLARATGRHPEAYERYADLYLRAPSSSVALQLGNLALGMGMPAEAELWFTEALERHTVSPEAMAGRVRSILLQEDREVEARELAEEYLVFYPDHAELVLIRASLLMQEGRLDEALADTRAALLEMPRNPRALSLCAEIYWEMGRPDKAIDHLMEARRIDRWHPPYRYTLTRWLLEVGRSAEAVRTIAPAARLLPDDEETQALYQQALARLEAERARPHGAGGAEHVPH